MRGSRGRAWPVRLAALLLVVTQAVAFAAPAAAETSPDFDPALAAKLQAILDRVRIERPIAGLAAVVTLADGSRWEGGSGFGDAFDGSQLFSAHTPSVAGSITKTFVAALILQLVEEGKLHLDDRLDDWVPEKGFSPRVRIKHLLRHTSGIPDYFRHPDYNRLVFNRPTHVWSKAEVMSLIKTTLRFTPGHSWSYSNSGFFLLGLIAERATHSTLGALLRQRFFVPLGLDETWLQGEHTLPTNSAKGYLWVNGRFKEYADGTSFRPHTSAATVAWGAGNILTTASDLSDWVRALYGG
ncbi:MAG TPA: serine hydrolase domain-containing protein, partial [Candidatus Limnocylindrales bacterium]|nr:serine hydrolase domain-containing protein [Candidatus Limnocylindrales bacterium]